MTAAVCLNSEVPRRLASHTPQRWFNARHTCSSVTSGFFPPQPLGLRRDKGQRQLAQRQVPQQRLIVLSLKVPKAQLTLAPAEPETGARNRIAHTRRIDGRLRSACGTQA